MSNRRTPRTELGCLAVPRVPPTAAVLASMQRLRHAISTGRADGTGPDVVAVVDGIYGAGMAAQLTRRETLVVLRRCALAWDMVGSR